MNFEDSLESLQKILRLHGYESIRNPIDISALIKDKSVHDCEIIARKDFYDILYMEAISNWRGIATDVVKKQSKPCLVITKYGESHLILSTIKNYATNPKPRHVVIDINSKTHSFIEFVKLIKVTHDDETYSIDLQVQEAFNKYVEYNEALNEFANNLRYAIKNTRETIVIAQKNNTRYNAESERFLEMCRNVISTNLQPVDITEMLLQHVLTYKIFSLLYDEHELHSTNAVARSLEGMVDMLGIDMEQMSAGYQTIKLVAESIIDSTEKQDFLKRVYETFYATYDPQNKDSWGIAYTPSEVVDFMVRSTEYLLQKHFKKSISDDCVTLLDPATGTGTFVTSIMQHLRPDALTTKYENDIFANDISILAYYIAALNIENTYQELTGKIKEFENICWMDTLTTGTKNFGKVSAYFESQDNVKRISRQQIKDICVVLGNPPYNAVQVSFNEANPADKYPEIDAKIADTYVKMSNVKSKGNVYDMYLRFMKWASERIKNNGMVVFVSNNSFLDAKSTDGVRRSVFEEFDYIYTVNLKGNARTSGEERRKQAGNVFRDTIRVGVSISFFVKTGNIRSEIQYAEVDNYLKSEDKLKWLANNSLSTLQLKQLIPDEDNYWTNPTHNDFNSLVPVVNEEGSIFKSLSLGTKSGRNEWVFDFDKISLGSKMKYFIDVYNSSLKQYNKEKPIINLNDWINKKIKWGWDILKHLTRNKELMYSKDKIIITLYRPFILKYQYFDKIIIERQRKFPIIFKNNKSNKIIGFTNPKSNIVFQTLATNQIIDHDCIIGTQCIPLYIYNDNDDKLCSNVTDFGLTLFQKYYKNDKITTDDIFYYVYAIFNDPKYQKTYKYNLQRKLPRIPLARDFEAWKTIGNKLYNLHVDFNDADPYPLKRIDKTTTKNHTRLSLVKPTKINRLKYIKIIIDNITTLDEIPNEVLQYKFNSKCALEWILESYKEAKNNISDKSCDDSKIREKFYTYKFADHKEHVIDLLQKVITVSIETVNLQKYLEDMPWGKQLERNIKPVRNIKVPKKSNNRKYKQTKKPKFPIKKGKLQDTLGKTK